jgi:hypothetical protein
MNEFYGDNQLTKEIVDSFDQALTTKANKTDLVKFEVQFRTLVLKKEFEERADKVDKKFNTLRD